MSMAVVWFFDPSKTSGARYQSVTTRGVKFPDARGREEQEEARREVGGLTVGGEEEDGEAG